METMSRETMIGDNVKKFQKKRELTQDRLAMVLGKNWTTFGADLR